MCSRLGPAGQRDEPCFQLEALSALRLPVAVSNGTAQLGGGCLAAQLWARQVVGLTAAAGSVVLQKNIFRKPLYLSGLSPSFELY